MKLNFRAVVVGVWFAIARRMAMAKRTFKRVYRSPIYTSVFPRADRIVGVAGRV